MPCSGKRKMFHPETELAKLPDNPGCYLMKDRHDTVIYVGKAKNLHRRVSQYFSGHDNRAFVSMLGDVLEKIDVIITQSEREALILEAGLIKRYRPRFNVLLKDDKDMPQLRIDLHEQWPRVEIVRRRKNDGAQYFGPYPSGQACRRSLAVLNRYFQLRTCTDKVFCNRTRPCLQYEIHRCLGPCLVDVDPSAYRRQCQDAILFLSGRYDDLKNKLMARMNLASEQLAFEQAALYRDQIMAVEEICGQQKIVQKTPVNQDYWALSGDAAMRCVIVLMVRQGRLTHMQTYEARDSLSAEADILLQIMVHHYQSFDNYPAEVVLDAGLNAQKALLHETLEALSGRRITLTFPQRGTKAALLDTARLNADQQVHQRRTSESDILLLVEQKLNLQRYPHRIECYDISNMQGGQIVAAMVVFIQGKLDASRCRTFKVRTTQGQDDFGSLHEVLTRRLRYLATTPQEAEHLSNAEASFCEMPDLLLIDGGHGQVHAVMDAVEASGMAGAFDVIGIAKSRMQIENADHEVEHSPERLVYHGVPEPLVLEQNDPVILLMANIRDETHKRAIGFHRRTRETETMKSRLDAIDGIGPKRRASLLKAFGSVANVARQTPEHLSETTGISLNLAQKIIEELNG